MAQIASRIGSDPNLHAETQAIARVRNSQAIYLAFFRSRKFDLAGRRSWCQSTHREFVLKAVNIIGLYMCPPDDAIWFPADEKSSMRGLNLVRGI